MTWVLRLFQITTVRSARMFLGFASLLFAFGVWQAAPLVLVEKASFSSFDAIFFAAWLGISGLYMLLGGWALFTSPGRSFLSSEEQQVRRRSVLWYLKYLFALYAAGFATVMLVSTLVLPAFGYAGFMAMSEPRGGLYILLAAALWAPLVYRYLR